uniref:Secreted protein n=1 Tax=Steinernema glaseri TaxID=37863 RepID=A0A1I8AGI1_9BILA
MAPCWSRSLSAAQTLLLLGMIVFQEAEGIGCFVCSSFNGSNPLCEDTFNSTIDQSTRSSPVGIANYQFPCWSFKKNREGLFPADHCIKVSGYRTDDSRQTMVIRTCALDSGTLTADTGESDPEEGGATAR